MKHSWRAYQLLITIAYYNLQPNSHSISNSNHCWVYSYSECRQLWSHGFGAGSVYVIEPGKLSKVSAPLIKIFCKMKFSSSMPVPYHFGVTTLPGLFAMLLLEVEKVKDHGKVTFCNR